MSITKTLVLPPWMNTIKFYHTDIHQFRVSSGVVAKDTYEDDCVIGVSLGALAILERSASVKGMVVLINPLVPQRGLWVWAWHWSRYILGGLFVERQRFTLNPLRWVSAVYRAYILLTTDFSEALKVFPKERLVVIRSKEDIFFCDSKAVEYLQTFGVRVVEIEGGHNWNVHTEDAMNKQIGDMYL